MEGAHRRAEEGELTLDPQSQFLCDLDTDPRPSSLVEPDQIYQDKTVENMAQWSQQKKDHEANMSTTAMSD